MEPSILLSVKKNLGLDEDYLVFDPDVLMYINAAFGTLNELGLGPALGFTVVDEEAVWADFLDDEATLNSVKVYVFLRTRLLFDPPHTSYLVAAFEKQVQELEWRLNVRREGTAWVDPDTDDSSEELEEFEGIDGGGP